MDIHQRLELAADTREIAIGAMKHTMRFCTSAIDTPRQELAYDHIDLDPLPQIQTSESSRKDFNPYITWPSTGEQVLPWVVANMRYIGTMKMAEAVNNEGKGVIVALDKGMYQDAGQLIRFFNESSGASRVMYTVGMRQKDRTLFTEVTKGVSASTIHSIRMDVPHGGLKDFRIWVKEVRDMHPNAFLAAGNVANPVAAKMLFDAGADAVVVGVGPGSFCSTRMETGHSHQQLGAVIKCAHVADQMDDRFVIADGGIKDDGDIAKAIGVGGALCGMGSMICGHAEGELVDLTKEELLKIQNIMDQAGDPAQSLAVGDRFNDSGLASALAKGLARFDKDGKLQIVKMGSSSELAMLLNNGGVQPHQAAEGIVGWADYKGPVQKRLDDMTGHLSSHASYMDGDVNTVATTPGARTPWSYRGPQ